MALRGKLQSAGVHAHLQVRQLCDDLRDVQRPGEIVAVEVDVNHDAARAVKGRAGHVRARASFGVCPVGFSMQRRERHVVANKLALDFLKPALRRHQRTAADALLINGHLLGAARHTLPAVDAGLANEPITLTRPRATT